MDPTEILWREEPFTCELRTTKRGLSLCVLKDGELRIQVSMASRREAIKAASLLRRVVVRERLLG
jgi:hypothetical protein